MCKARRAESQRYKKTLSWHLTIANIRDYPVTKKQKKSHRRPVTVGDDPALAKAACFLALNAQTAIINH
jgi:hypothetical protein